MELWDYCFEKKEDPFFQWYFREYCLTHNLIMGGFSEATNRLVNMLHLNPYRILLRGREEVVPYIVGVATDPAARGQELTKGLLQASFNALHDSCLLYTSQVQQMRLLLKREYRCESGAVPLL